MAERLGKYELLQVLGKGAMGTVYEGFDPIIARRLAIKTVKLPGADDAEAQDELARFKREAQAAGRLSHPNIVGVFDYGETPEIAYIVMEFVDGTTLKHVVDKKERFEIPEIVRLMEGVLAGLQFSHDRGVVHRDIKPANIMLTKAGEVKIADFGIARIESSSMTQAGTMLGTPAYMSPEQFMGQTVDSRTDIYSSGVLLYQLLTGDKPFEGGLTAIMHKVLNTEPPPPSALSVTVPHALDQVVQRAMAKRPEDRFASAAEFARALREAATKPAGSGFSLGADEFAASDATMVATALAPARPPAGAPPAPPPVLAPPAPPPKKSPPYALFGGGVVVLLLLAGGAFFFLGSGHKSVPVPPTPPPVVWTPATREAALSTALGTLSCTLISGDDSGAQPAISGLAGAGAPQAALTSAIAALPAAIRPTSSVQTVDGPYCGALDAIRPYHSLFGNAAMRLGLALDGGTNTLHQGDKITIDNTMPGFASYLQTDYFSSDGSVYHVYPPQGAAAQPQPAATVKSFLAGTVAPPFGTDIIISIASSSPLFQAARPVSEPASGYLPALSQALQTATGNVAAAALPVITLAKQQ